MPILSEALATTLLDCAVSVVTHVPGYGATETFAAWNRIAPTPSPISFHEEPAFTIAHGAAVCGARSATLLKSHGLAKAANSAVDSLFAGTVAGFVSVIFDDATGAHSDCIFDVDALLRGIGIPFQRCNPGSATQALRAAFATSERLQLPVAIILDAADVHQEVPAPISVANPQPHRHLRWARSIAHHLVSPLFASHQRDRLQAKLRGESLEAIAETITPPAIPTTPDDLPETWRRAALPLVPFFQEFRTIRGQVVAGDTGLTSLFAFPPFDCVDITTYMGGSVPLAIGAMLAGRSGVWGGTGDFSFIAAGHLGLIEATTRQLPLKLFILDNGAAVVTGGQPIGPGMLDSVLAGYADSVRRIVLPAERDQIRAVLEEAAAATEMRIVVVECR
jgi:TPP-dependent indolepyruvate ferredoxin oxidoreductase alpha subunit